MSVITVIEAVQRNAAGTLNKFRVRWFENGMPTGLEKDFNRYSLIREIERGHQFQTHSTVGPVVRVVSGTYLRSDANNINEDNLGELPTF